MSCTFIRSLFLWVLVGVLFLTSVTGVGILYLVQSDGQWLARQVERAVARSVGVSVSLPEGVQVEVSPSFVILAESVRIHDAYGAINAQVGALRVHPQWLSFLRGEFIIRSLDVDNAAVSLQQENIVPFLQYIEHTFSTENIPFEQNVSYNNQLTLMPLQHVIIRNSSLTIWNHNKQLAHATGVNATFPLGMLADRANLSINEAFFEEAFFDDTVEATANASTGKAKASDKTAEARTEATDGMVLHDGSPLSKKMDGILSSAVEEKAENSTVKLVHVTKTSATLSALSLVNGVLSADAILHGKIESSSVLRFVNVSLEGRVALDTKTADVSILDGRCLLDGAIHLANYDTPLHVDASFVWQKDNTLILTDTLIDFDGDSGTLNGKVTGFEQGDPVLKGRLLLHQLSLPRWFGFARRLPPGLQHSLNALSGVLDFTLTKEGVVVPYLEANVLGMKVSGTGATENFRKPVVAITVAGLFIDVNKVMPELMDVWPKAPVFSMNAPVPVPGTPEAEALDIPDIGYDIRVRAQEAKVNLFQVGDLAFRCSPSPNGSLLTFDSPRAYDGTIHVALDVVDDGYTVKAAIAHLSLDKPTRTLVGWDALTGTMDMTLDVKTGDYSTLRDTLHSVTGTVKTQIRSGGLLLEGQKESQRMSFRTVSLETMLKKNNKALDEATLHQVPFTGQWRGEAALGQGIWTAFSLNGTILYDLTTWLPVQTKRTPAHITLFVPEKMSKVSGGLSTSFSSLFSANLVENTLSFSNINGKLLGGTYGGTLHGSGLNTTPRWHGTVNIEHASAKTFLESFGVSLWKPTAQDFFGVFRLRANINMTKNAIELGQLQLFIDKSRFGGNFRYTPAGAWHKRPQYHFDIMCSAFTLDDYFPPSSTTNSTTQAKEKKTSSSLAPKVSGSGKKEIHAPWNLGWLRNNDVQGQITFGSLQLYEQRLTNVVIPISLRANKLVIDKAVGRLHGGDVHLVVHAGITRHIDISTFLSMQNFQLESFFSPYLKKDYVGGIANFGMQTRSILQSFEDIPQALNGTWFFDVQNGYYSSQGQGELADKRTSFSSVTASGTFKDGVLHNNNFRLTSLLVTMKGDGWVNLVTQRINYLLDVSFARVPNVPIRFTGSLRSPETQVEGIGVITGTIQNIGGGLLGLVKGVLSAPVWLLKLFNTNSLALPPPASTIP